MAWSDVKASGTGYPFSEYNKKTKFLQWVSGSYMGHSGNTDIHFPSSQIRPWLNVHYKGTGAAAGGGTLSGPMVGNIGANFNYGISGLAYLSSQIIRTSSSIMFKNDRGIYINDDETYVGHGAGDSITTGVGNTLIGHDAGVSITEQNYNTFVGFCAGEDSTTSVGSNTGIGTYALQKNITGYYNTVVGYQAGALGTNMDGTVLIGWQAGYNNTADSTVAMGNSALRDNTEGLNNTAIGYGTLTENITGDNNVAIGRSAGGATATNIDSCVFVGNNAGQFNTQNNITAVGRSALNDNRGLYNTALGYLSLNKNSSATYNTAIGYNSIYNNITGNTNTGIGSSVLGSNVGGHGNTAIGVNALFTNVKGDYNTAIGYYAGRLAAADVNYCVYIGNEAGEDNTEDNRLFISHSDTPTPLIYGEFDTGKVVINSHLESAGISSTKISTSTVLADKFIVRRIYNYGTQTDTYIDLDETDNFNFWMSNKCVLAIVDEDAGKAVEVNPAGWDDVKFRINSDNIDYLFFSDPAGDTIRMSGNFYTSHFISTQTGVYANFISANHSNITGVGGGDVSATGSPADNEYARWTDGTTIEGVTFFSGTAVSGGTLVGKYNYTGEANRYIHYKLDDIFGSNIILAPSVNSDISLGENALRFRNGYFSGSVVTKSFAAINGFIHSQLKHYLDNDTNITFNDDNLLFVAGNNTALSIGSSNTTDTWFSSQKISGGIITTTGVYANFISSQMISGQLALPVRMTDNSGNIFNFTRVKDQAFFGVGEEIDTINISPSSTHGKRPYFQILNEGLEGTDGFQLDINSSKGHQIKFRDVGVDDIVFNLSGEPSMSGGSVLAAQYVSAQNISGGTIIVDTITANTYVGVPTGGGGTGKHFAYSYTIYPSGDTYQCSRSRDGSVVSTDSDAQVPIQYAIDASTDGKGTVFLASGTFIISQPITMKNYVRLTGVGREQSIIKLSSNADDYIVNTAAQGDYCEIDNICFDFNGGNGNVNPETDGIFRIDDADYAFIHNCRFTNNDGRPGVGLYLNLAQGKVFDNYIDLGSDTMVFLEGNQLHVSRNYVTDTSGVKLIGNNTLFSENKLNKTSNDVSYGLIISGSEFRDTVVQNNYFEGHTIQPTIWVQGNLKKYNQLNIKNNTIAGAHKEGILLDCTGGDEAYITIENNFFKRCGMESSDGYAVIKVGAYASGTIIRDNVSYNQLGTDANTGIEVTAGATNTIIVDNIMPDAEFTDDAIDDNGTNTYISQLQSSGVKVETTNSAFMDIYNPAAGGDSVYTILRNSDQAWWYGIAANDDKFFIKDHTADNYPFKMEINLPDNLIYMASGLNNEGRIGVLTKSPDYNLHVDGSIYGTSVSSQSISGGKVITKSIISPNKLDFYDDLAGTNSILSISSNGVDTYIRGNNSNNGDLQIFANQSDATANIRLWEQGGMALDVGTGHVIAFRETGDNKILVYPGSQYISDASILGADYVSSQIISGGIIRTKDPTENYHVVTKSYGDANYIGTATLAGNLVGNLSGASYVYGLKDMDFVSSQSISGQYQIPHRIFDGDTEILTHNVNYGAHTQALINTGENVPMLVISPSSAHNKRPYLQIFNSETGDGGFDLDIDSTKSQKIKFRDVGVNDIIFDLSDEPSMRSGSVYAAQYVSSQKISGGTTKTNQIDIGPLRIGYEGGNQIYMRIPDTSLYDRINLSPNPGQNQRPYFQLFSGGATAGIDIDLDGTNLGHTLDIRDAANSTTIRIHPDVANPRISGASIYGADYVSSQKVSTADLMMEGVKSQIYIKSGGVQTHRIGKDLGVDTRSTLSGRSTTDGQLLVEQHTVGVGENKAYMLLADNFNINASSNSYINFNIGGSNVVKISSNGFPWLSSQTISGGIIRTKSPTENYHVVTKGYGDSNYIGAATLKGNLVGNLSGASYAYGLKDMDFVSSQAISGGSIRTNEILGHNFTIQRNGATDDIYFRGRDSLSTDDLYIFANNVSDYASIRMFGDSSIDLRIDGAGSVGTGHVRITDNRASPGSVGLLGYYSSNFLLASYYVNPYDIEIRGSSNIHFTMWDTDGDWSGCKHIATLDTNSVLSGASILGANFVSSTTIRTNTDITFSNDRGIFIDDNETYVGHGAGDSIVGGANNTFIGHDAGNSVTAQHYNVFVGVNAGQDASTGDGNNTAVGAYSYLDNTTGICNTTLGCNSGRLGTSYRNCTYIGWGAGWNGTENNITAVGYEALKADCNFQCTAVGYKAGEVTTGKKDTFVGFCAGRSNTGGNYNTYIGNEAGSSNTDGHWNTFIGSEAGRSNVSADYNTFVGNLAAYLNTDGHSNTAVGRQALAANTTGDFNTAIGMYTGRTASNGLNGCVYLGNKAGSSNTVSNTLHINDNGSFYPLIYGEFDNSVVKLGNNDDDWTGGLVAGSVSSQNISGSWTTPLHVSKPTAGDYPGQIIRTSGNANGTWVWISVYNGSAYEWIQLGVST